MLSMPKSTREFDNHFCPRLPQHDGLFPLVAIFGTSAVALGWGAWVLARVSGLC
jgi:hypothetical protein